MTLHENMVINITLHTSQGRRGKNVVRTVAVQWNLSWETTAMRDHLSWKTTHFWQKGQHFKYNWICHQRPPVLRNHISVAKGVVFQDKFYCIYIQCDCRWSLVDWHRGGGWSCCCCWRGWGQYHWSGSLHFPGKPNQNYSLILVLYKSKLSIHLWDNGDKCLFCKLLLQNV